MRSVNITWSHSSSFFHMTRNRLSWSLIIHNRSLSLVTSNTIVAIIVVDSFSWRSLLRLLSDEILLHRIFNIGSNLLKQLRLWLRRWSLFMSKFNIVLKSIMIFTNLRWIIRYFLLGCLSTSWSDNVLINNWLRRH